MFVRRAEDVSAQRMAMPGAEGVSMRLMVGRTDGAPNFAMRLFEVEPGGHTPMHRHNYEHEVMVLEGSGQLAGGEAGESTSPIRGGDVVFMPPNELHQFRNTGDTPLRFMCLVPVSFDCGKNECAVTPGT